ncbi:hypothetical protein HYN56_12620 [Flavobacterium crocinum]|uniref:Uncharacterized protein n=1 Tax=Flavobacterium crocinum TaxID=2183896 RepID=A0A2S1YLS5_9FLAO|nr:hypothetical protein [Flavobacterium crocinum]AWK05025.1 hypothetical protein HYN56_12620 [Flavobacterium crocinum]
MNTPNRIYFLGNPYPNGHALEEFEWSGRIEEDESIWFDFHLKTENYYAEDDTNLNDEEDEDAESDWDAKGVWENFHRCTMSSTFWGDNGIKINTKSEKVSFNDLIKEALLADTFPLDDDYDYDDVAFGIYLLGHDSCANHRIQITPTTPNRFDIDWSGKIALTYVGNYEFKYDFKLHLENVEFDGFYYPKTWSVEKAGGFFKTRFADFEDYEFVDLNPKSNKREYKFKKK